MERKIGDVFKYNGKKYIVKEEIKGCNGCAFLNFFCLKDRNTVGECVLGFRSDHKGVIFVEYKEDKVMENLLNCKGRRFKCKIEGDYVEGKIQVEDGYVYLCQNIKKGDSCKDKLEYLFSWIVDTGSKDDLIINGITEFEFINMTKEDIENYKDWQVGDKIVNLNGIKGEIIFRSGKLVVFENENGYASGNYTVKELYDSSWRLDAQPEEEVVEIDYDEAFKILANVKGVTTEQVRIKEKK